jgi:RNA polymerase sigma factor (sigma-70 family)
MQAQEVESEFLAALRKGVPEAFETLYRRYYRMVEDMVMKYRGDANDARDVFQEALFVFVKKLREPEFVLTSKASTYLYAVARNLYLKKLGKPVREVNFEQQQFQFPDMDGQLADTLSAAEQESLVSVMATHLAKLEEDCKAVITYAFYQNLSHAEIAGLMGYSEGFVKVKKFRCLEYLRKMLRNTPEFKNL